MTSPSASITHGGAWPNYLAESTRGWFTAAGWTSGEWNDVYCTVTHGGAGSFGRGRQELREWLRDPPVDNPAVLSPADVLGAITRFGEHAPESLNAYTRGASERFVSVMLGDHPRGNAEKLWELLHDTLGLTEPEATGWACTLPLYVARGWPITRTMLEPEIARWTGRFGPDAWLHVLAGFTLEEAVGLQYANTPVSGQQLRVMAALNGTRLPAGL